MKNIIFLCLTVCLHLFATAQNSSKIKIGGPPQTKTIVCNGEEVIVSGERHNLTIQGYCFSLTVYADRSTIKLDSVRLIFVHGDKNHIRYKTPVTFTTKISRFGSMNRVEKED